MSTRVADASPPGASLEIHHVYGFRSFDTRNNLKYSYTNELVYHSGAIGICLDTNKNVQRFFMEHTDDVTCLDVSDMFAVTGQMGRQPTIFVWDLTTMEVRAVLRGLFKIGVSNIAISNDQKKVVAIGMDDDQCIGIYDIDRAIVVRQNGKRDDSLVASGKGPRSEIFDVKFDKSDKTIVIACKCEVNFVTFDNQTLKVMKGGWEPKICPLQSVTSVGVLDNSVVTGTFKG
jgi:WD40 repeat protein